MYTTVSTSSTATYSDSSRHILSPVALAPRPTTIKDSFGWFYPNDSILEPTFENWPKPPLESSSHPNLTSTVLSPSSQKFPTSNNMPSRTTEVTDRTSVPNGSSRWRVNSSGQFVNAEAESASWELADEIGRLKIGDVTADAVDARVNAIRTPPKSKMAPNAVINESSPLDSSSNTSVGSSPPIPEQQISHSRGSSADVTPSTEAKERPHSFSGGLSAADLRRLQQAGDADHDRQIPQQQQWNPSQYRDQNNEQLSYPSLSSQAHRTVPQQPAFNYPPSAHQTEREDAQIDYNQQQQQQSRNFAAVPPHLNHGLAINTMNTQGQPQSSQFNQSRPNNGAAPAMNYRQAPRNFAPQGPSAPPALGYGGGHTSHLSLGNTQQLYEMMLPGPPPVHDNHHPAIARVQQLQQQHNVFRGTHHHSTSDPSSALRDVAALQLLNSNMQNFNPNLFQPGIPPQPMQLYPNQYYGAPAELAVQQVMAARLQGQYTGSYNIPAPTVPREEVGSPTSSSGQTGPSANNRKLGLYKTELCRSWEEKGTCRYGGKCQFAHGEDELRKVSRHPKYKTEICKTFWVSGSCPYGKRCCFIHTELSATTPATASTSENTPPQPAVDGRQRSDSDPATSGTLVSRLPRQQPDSSTSNTPSTPVEIATTNNFQFSRPPTGSLRVDTSALDGASMKQNKSAYPSFASNGIMLPASEHNTIKSPAPVTAGPVVGRHHLARMEIVGYPNHQKKNSTSSTTNSNPRHSFDGSDADLNFSPSPPTGYNYGQDTNAQQGPAAGPPRVNGHVRSGSAGNWGSIPRSNLSTSTSAHPHGGASAAGEIMSNSPWSSTELAVGSSRLHEKTWV